MNGELTARQFFFASVVLLLFETLIHLSESMSTSWITSTRTGKAQKVSWNEPRNEGALRGLRLRSNIPPATPCTSTS
jgi:hypothetical protein